MNFSLNFNKEKFLRSKTAAGVECIFGTNGEAIFKTVVLHEQKSKIETLGLHESKKLSELKNSIPHGTPVVIAFTGKGIIHKKIATAAEEGNNSLLQKILPNAELKDFYLLKHEQVNGREGSYISVVRKNSVDQLLKELKGLNVSVVGITIGPFVLQNLFRLITDADDFEVTIFNNQFQVHNNIIKDYKQLENGETFSPLTIGENSLPQTYATAFASAFQYLIEGEASFQFTNDFLAEERNDFLQRKIFEKTGLACIAIFLAILLINFLMFQHYAAKNEEINSQLSLLQNHLQRYNNLEKDLKSKKAFLTENGLLQTSRTSYYADQIAYDLPLEIQLTAMNIFPLTKVSGNGVEDKLLFKQGKISVSGTCYLSSELNEWIKVLKKKKWINKVNVMDYHQDNLKSPGQFTIELEII